MKRFVYSLLGATLLFAQSCANTNLTEPGGLATQVEQRFILNTKAQQIEASELNNIVAYVFSEDILVKIITNISMQESAVVLNVPINSQVYFLAELGVPPASISSVRVNKTDLATFLSLSTDVVKEDAAHSAPQFFTGHHNGASDVDKVEHEIVMTRSVARLDLDTSSDPLIKIQSVTAQNVPLASLIFAGQLTTQSNIATGIATKRFGPPASGLHEGFMYLFESSSPISLTLQGTYNDVPIVVNVSIASIKRNSAYTIKVNNIGTSISGAIHATPWQQGGTIEGSPDLNHTISIDVPNTTLDEGITIDKESNHITISEKGGDLGLALSAEYPVIISSIEGLNSLISVGEPSSQTVGNKLLTTIPIAANAQQKGQLPYQLKVNLKSPFTQNAYDYLIIDVEGNQSQIPTVSFGGHQIMAFNTTGSDLASQVYLPEGISVEDMYKNYWADCTGKMFQYGRSIGYYPHLQKVKQSLPSFRFWDHTNGAPCPPGFRMLNRAELTKLMPPSKDGVLLDGSVPINYYIDGKPAKMEIISPAKTITIGGVRNITPRYVRLTYLSDTLIFPMAGYQWTDGIGVGAARLMGSSFFIMAPNRDDSYTVVYGHDSMAFQNGHRNVQPRHLNNFNFVRCVKE